MTRNTESLLSLAILGSNDDGTVSGTSTIEGSRIRPFQYRHREDVLRVEVGDGILVVAPYSFRIKLRVIHGYSINDEEWLVLARDRGLATYHDSTGAHVALAIGDAHTRQLARKRIDQVVVLARCQLVGRYFLRSITQGFLLARDTHGGNHYLVKVGGVGSQHHIDDIAFDGHRLGLHTEIGYCQFLGGYGKFGDGQLSIHIRYATHLAVLYENGCAYHRLTVVCRGNLDG